MNWIHRFQLFLFDFDGLLVDTEPLHFQAYINMLAKRGFKLDWSLAEFCKAAHLNAFALKDALYAAFPDLDPNWPMLYEEKKQNYQELLLSGKVELMPGVEKLLQSLEKANIERCVVTNSSLAQTLAIRRQLPILKTVAHWITREDYEEPKPHPECYLRAIQFFGKKGDRIIGFEDSIRGLEALKKTPALAVLICPSHHPLVEMASDGIVHFESFTAIPADVKL